MKSIIIGTAGHVDHGKTTLIRALTGIETDRLREEQERGMSIELGFAYFDLPGGARAGIVDVPGHERFIKNMLMGATGMDMVVLVVAADEGVMPQTREHFSILRLLDVHSGLIALTKADLVDPDWLELVSADVQELVAGSFLEGAPIIPVSSTTRQGLPELIAAMDRIAEQTQERIAAGPFRLPIDRVFTVAGFGTVVTGTLRSGVARAGEAAVILPGKTATRVRSVQVHGERAESARAGSRVALNLAGIEVSDASRGDVVAAAGSLEPTSMVDVRLELLSDLPKPLAHRSRIRFHTGAAEIIGRVALLDREEALPGQSVLAQIRLESPTAVGRGDRFVLRRYSPGALLGGGSVLDPHPRRHRRNQPGLVEALLVRERGTPEDLMTQTLLQAGPAALAIEEIVARSGLGRAEVTAALQILSAAQPATGATGGHAPEDEPLAAAVGTRWIHTGQLRELERLVLDILDEFHRQHPLQAGMPKEELRARAGRSLDSRAYNFALGRLEAAGALAQDLHLVRRASHEVQLQGAQGEAAECLRETYRGAGLNPPSLDEALARCGPKESVRPVFDVLVHRGDLVRIAEGLYLERSVIEAAEANTVALLKEQGSVTVSQLRDAVGSSRKVIVPLLEHFDAQRITRRRGDERVLY